ncbi:50S ribosomal protein L16 [Candidatus Woesebacteria bacterium RIFCSPLOWO2_01_FULL_39_61]|uniref:Large ribosomal subunit protein uL16 n=2 Tax=Microgenomates group TaxID=1794810 RepID=A0A0H4TQ98_9BACT|nr:50S ribosomal protein L16, large subunit ribosomal protein L16 [uncultured Microgenomates bacterium Rifle_16ft_4_minimus_37836]OGM28081.1 MAG: 50S ribosomal protein L16 [Candidatus Woesebacteria bacterium RIFCSPHIGHO2_01_FULL_39_95]OGM34069.1 MAG: 50S ribosomal protein L16 [Candidatus Woesebacteria bacterium RIFCSPHIGHO2_02_FULL_39_13]OGM38328.1 MAG: 50S ribosomal protein L16 [Candidatus Woesebacteria bacterium RIFCSPHIGHO2_12_FULL_40_20]OGM67791.1 MAG: 50S ribosomal protein L16 [Candidatus 
MLEPKRRKYRKSFRGRRKGKAYRGSTLAFGEYGLKSLGRAWLSSRQIEAGRRAVTHSLKRGGRVWIRVFPDKPVTSRPAGQRMGSGKGDIDRYVAVITPGKIIYEVAGISKELAENAFAKAGAKMPFKTKVVSREIYG